MNVKLRIFDFHTHPGYNFHDQELGYHITPERFVNELKKCGVDKCAGSMLTKEDYKAERAEYATIIPRLNWENYKFYMEYPDFLVPGIHIHPDFLKLSCDEVRKYGELGVRLIGELVPRGMNWSCDYDSLAMQEILSVANEYDMVVSAHPTNLIDMENFAKHNPDTNIVFAHLDAYGLYEGEIELMKKYKNVYFDISAHAIDRQGMIRQAIDSVGEERILFGTDYPGYSEEAFIQCVKDNKLTLKEQEAIFWGNAIRLLKIEDRM